ncbi:MAG: glycosyltransferase family 4 protein [Patescibacteria group bacterium]|nr:glycosyltransferase family 4 protein [Patescibacteria group bacterium]
MRVLTIGSDPSIFVAGSAARERMRSYAATIGELHILSPAKRGTREEHEGNLYLHPIRAGKLFRVHSLARRARALIRTHDIEIVSAQDPFEHGLAARRAVRGTHAKLHIQVHTDFLSPWFVKSGWRMSFLNRIRRNIASRVLPAADGIRAVSERVKASLIARYGARIPEPSVIPIAVDSTVPEPVPLPMHSFAFALITIGRLEPEKRIGDILKALKLVTTRYPMIGLFIVGDGRERRRLERTVRSLKLEKHVVFLGAHSDARALLGSAQTFIQASAYEGYGRTLIEAALAKVPIITTDVGIVGDVLKHNEEVLVAPIARPKALARCIETYIEDNTLRQGLPVRAELAVRAHLAAAGSSPERIRADLERAFRHP